MNAKEFGLLANENPWQGSAFLEWLTDTVEAAVLEEFERISERGGVLGAMETGYQRSRIQEESLHYERLKHSGEFPIVGVNTFLDPNRDANVLEASALTRATKDEKDARLAHVRDFQQRHRGSWMVDGGSSETEPARQRPTTHDPRPTVEPTALSSRARAEGEGVAISTLPERLPGQTPDAAAPWQIPCAEALAHLQAAARSGGNLFAELLQTVCSCSLGQITHALYEVGGQYRRSM
ncbi:MAG: hypothetical protein B7Z68_04680 [Acidobacteria bacterium 21-70-11]|nr:MAG: hypothetical protein B7Z68_04680 [Acidobacteria bacterium 21-70-11]